jgi:hypothetical protein
MQPLDRVHVRLPRFGARHIALPSGPKPASGGTVSIVAMDFAEMPGMRSTSERLLPYSCFRSVMPGASKATCSVDSVANAGHPPIGGGREAGGARPLFGGQPTYRGRDWFGSS